MADPGPPDPQAVRCPTCRAAQGWSDTCRRCRSDLGLLRAAAAAYWHRRRACLAHLRDGRPRAALRDARRCVALSDDLATRRLLAACALACADWPAAAALARSLPDPP